MSCLFISMISTAAGAEGLCVLFRINILQKYPKNIINYKVTCSNSEINKGGYDKI